ncbi:hypothetical protein BGZ51_007482 [Haplosporangium sp. Z 767]|nr:hypothetical protein BGZ51_007482 [Haplosporangium sp. Z 767]KAF9194148.1 hypothetical protein BGZ50_006627 [Haplosporangium sp. Z 11]
MATQAEFKTLGNTTNPILPLTAVATSRTSRTDATAANTQAANESSQMYTSDLTVSRRHLGQEKAIEHVLQRGKVLKVSRRLRTRLEYAILKIRRGWSKYTLQEVESLIQPGCSPRITARQLQNSSSLQSSPRLNERKHLKRQASYELASPHKHVTESVSSKSDLDLDTDTRLSASSAPSTPTTRYRARMPSLSQFKDSELFQPAKSLMDIATSKPEPGYMSPYNGSRASSPVLAQQHPRQSGTHSPYQRPSTPEPLYRDSTPARGTLVHSRFSAPTTPTLGIASTFSDDEQEDENGVPSEAQVARTILMLSSPTRPSPRTLNQNYIMDMHSGSPTHSPLGEWTAPYSPLTSSPLVHFQTVASKTPSPDQTPAIPLPSTPTMNVDEDRAGYSSSPRGSPYQLSRAPRPTYTGLYGLGHGPSSPSPLSSLLIPSSNDSLHRIKSHSQCSSPTLKRAVRFAAAATHASELKLAADSMKEKMSGMSSQGEYNSTADNIYPGSQPGRDDKKEHSPSLFASRYEGDSYSTGFGGNAHNRAMTPPPLSSYSESSSTMNASRSHGMRTPPPSGGNDLDMSLYSLGGMTSSALRRRGSGPLPAEGMTDLTTMIRSRDASSSASSSSSYRP